MRAEVFGESGFSTTLKLDEVELGILRNLVRAQYDRVLSTEVPEHMGLFRALPMTDYHKRSELLRHGPLWIKRNRILPTSAVLTIRNMPFMKELEREFGAFQITNEEGVRTEEIYWRIVRPNAEGDIGTLHADRWFWDLGHGAPLGTQRVKVWIPLWCEPGRSGLSVVPGSHRKQFQFHGDHGTAYETRATYRRPVIDESVRAELLHTEPGTAVCFHEALLHGGVNTGASETRISLEFMLWN